MSSRRKVKTTLHDIIAKLNEITAIDRQMGTVTAIKDDLERIKSQVGKAKITQRLYNSIKRSSDTVGTFFCCSAEIS